MLLFILSGWTLKFQYLYFFKFYSEKANLKKICCISKSSWTMNMFECPQPAGTCWSPLGASWPRRWGRAGRPRPPWPPPCCCQPRTPPPAAGCWCPPLAACLEVDITIATRVQNSVFVLSSQYSLDKLNPDLITKTYFVYFSLFVECILWGRKPTSPRQLIERRVADQS